MNRWTIAVSLALGASLSGCVQRDASPPVAAATTEASSPQGEEVTAAELEKFLKDLASESPPPSGKVEGDAQKVFNDAVAEAAKADKRLLVHFGAAWCKWCGPFEAGLHANEDLLKLDYVLVKIDADMAHADEIAAQIGKGPGEGIPWFAITDKDGKMLVTCEDPTFGNIGHPVELDEIGHFISMLEKTAQHLTPAQIAEFKTRWLERTAKFREE